MVPEASPAPIFSSVHEARSKRISLDVSKGGKEMTASLNWHRVIAILVHGTSADGVVRRVPPLCMGHCQPVHETRKFAFNRPHHQMPMIWHHTKGKDPSGHDVQRFDKNSDEGIVVGRIDEEALAADRTIHDVHHESSDMRERPMRHGMCVVRSNSHA